MAKRLSVSTIPTYGVKAKSKKLSINTTYQKPQNDGSGVAYVGKKLWYGLAGLGEGLGNFVEASYYQIIGDDEYAKYIYEKDTVGEWNAKLDADYNPSGTMRVVGDIAEVVGQAIPSVVVGVASGGSSAVAQGISYAGNAALTMAYMGQGTASAVQQTGELGLKENIYGIASGALEGVTEKFLGGMQKAGKGFLTVARQGAKAGAGKVARQTVVKGMLSSAASEGLEEFLQELADVQLLKLTGVNKEAEFSWSDALYSGFLGFVSGGMLGGVSGATNTVYNARRGADVRARGNADALIKTAQLAREELIGNSANYDNVTSTALRSLTASLDAYSKLENKNGLRADILLGEIKAELSTFEASAGVDRIKTRMMESDLGKREIMAKQASARFGTTVTADDIASNKGDITRRMAMESFIYNAFSESDYDKRVAAINEAIAAERVPYVKQSASWDGESSAVYRDPASGKFIVVEPQKDGSYALGYTETAQFDSEKMMTKKGVSLEEVKAVLSGLADGSMELGENGIFKRKAPEAPKAPDAPEKAAAPEAQKAPEGDRVSSDEGKKPDADNKNAETDKKSKPEKKQSRKKKKAAKKAEAKKAGVKYALAEDSEAEAKGAERAQDGTESGENEKDGQTAANEAQEAAEGEIEGDSTPEMTERERRRGYTDAEADAARAIIKDFDTMPRSKRLAIVGFLRSCEGNNIPSSFKKHAAAMMAHWRKGLWIVVDNKSTEKGFYRSFPDGSRLIVVNPAKATGKGATDIAYMHELGHDIWTRANAEMRKELYALATEGTTREERIGVRDRYRAGFKARGLKISNEVIREEIFTEFMSKALGNPKFFDRFDMSPTRKKGFWQMMKSTYRMAKCFFGKDKQLYMRSERMATAIARVMGAQLLDMSGVGQSVENKYAISSQYDFTKPFYLQVEDYKNGVFPAGDSLLLGGTPDVFTQIGLNPLPMTINQKHVDYALNGTKNAEHHIGEIFLKYLPTALKNPVAIIASKTHNQTSLVAILSITHNGHQITAPVYIDGAAKQNGIYIDSNAVSSVYARKNAITSYLADAVSDEVNGKIGLFYWDKKRAIALLSREKVTMPNVVNTWSDGSLHSIHEKGSPVKPKLKNITESQQFKRWFGDWQKHPQNASKVVNADGTPKILYHQTAEEFTEFDPRRKGAGTNDDETPFGIFLKPTDDDIGLRGKKQMPLYARIVNPLMVQDRYELSQKLKAMSSEYSKLIAQREALSQEYKKKIEDAGKAWAQYAKEYRETHPGATRSEISEDAEFKRLFDAEDILVDEWVSKANDLAIQCKEVITKTLKAKKYDGVFIKKDAGSFGRVVETYIALESTQVKSATNNIGTFDGSNPDIRYSLDDNFDKDAFFANAMENGGVISHEEAEAIRANSKPEPEKSQTAGKKPKAAKTAKELEEENKALNKRVRELEKANDKLAEGVGRVQRDNREKRSEGRKQEHMAEVAERKAKRLEGKLEAERANNEKLLALEKQRMEEKIARAERNAQKATENAQKNAEKHIAHEQDKMKRESADLLRRESRAITRIIRNIEFFKNNVLHRKGTDGAVEGAKILSDPAIRAFAEIIAKKSSAYSIIHESSREAARAVRGIYNPDNPLFGANPMAEFMGADGASDIFSNFNADVANAIEVLANGSGQLSAYEIGQLDILVGYFAKLYRTYDTIRLEGKRIGATAFAHSGYEGFMFARRTVSGGDGKGVLKRIFKSVREGYLYSVVTPEVVLRDIERHVKDGVLSRLYRQIRLGEAEAGRIRATLLWDISEWLAKHKKFHEALEKERFDFGGVKISTAQAVGIYETSKREHAKQRLFSENEGIRIATSDGEVKNIKVTKEMIDKLYKQFTAEDIEYVKLLEKAMAECKKYKIDTDMEVMGFTNAIDGHYYPITIDKNYFAKDITDIRQAFGIETVKNKSFNQNTVKDAKAWLFIESSQRVLERHVFGISQYAGLFEPLQAFGKVYAIKFDPAAKNGYSVDKDGNERVSLTGKTSLGEYLNSTIWTEEGLDKYLTKLFADIQQVSKEQATIVDKFISSIRSGYINSIFGANLKIIFTQLAAYPSAYRTLDADCLAKALNRETFTTKSGELMDKYSRLTLSRRFEGTTASEGLVSKVSDFGKKMSMGIEWTDRKTIMALFAACQHQVEKDGGGAVGSEKNLKAAGELLDNILLDTQTTSLISDRSVLMRSKSEFAKLLTMFKTESMKSFSQMYDAVASYVDHKKMAKEDNSYKDMLEDDKKRIGRNAGAYLISAAWVSALSIAFTKLYNIGKEDDEELGEAIIKEAIGAGFDMIPNVSDIAAFMIDGYDMDSIPLSFINDSLGMLRDIGTVFDGNATRAEKMSYLRNSVFTIGKLIGFPVQNIYKTLRAAVAIVDRPTVYAIDNFFDKSPSYKSDIERAIGDGNTPLSQTVMRLWISDKITGKARTEVVDELVRLYGSTNSNGEKIFTMPKSVPSKLSAAQKAKFTKAYEGADEAVYSLIRSRFYHRLDDKVKAQAVKACYDVYYVHGQQACSLEVTASGARISAAEKQLDSNILYAVIGFARSYEGEDKRAAIISFLLGLGIGPGKRNAYLAALGYKI